ncbi:MAG TPA: MATE family efflux transporter [Bacteroidales bacterium]|nr:MATE family efflux transporter [Bacteroidales bacterium]
MNKLNESNRKFIALKTFLSDVREAVSGTEQDFTEGRLGRAILLLSVPSILEMLMESIFVIVDIYFVSRLGAEAVATVGLTESLVTIIYAIAMGLGTATTSLISRRIGEKRPEAASRTAVQAILTGLLISIIIGLPGVLFSKQILAMMGASETIVNDMSGYMTVMLGSNVVIMMLFIINAIFRSAGDAAVAMKVLWTGNIINIILDPILIFGWGPFPELGVTGAAVATGIGRGTAVLVQFYLLFFGNKRIRILLKQIDFDFRIIIRLLKLSVGSIGQNLIGTLSWIGMVRIISIFGSEVVAGYTIAIRIVNFAILPSWGISNASSTLVGQNLGAKKPERAEKAVWVTGWVNMILLGIIGLLLFLFPSFFIQLFIKDELSLVSGIKGLKIISAGFIAYGLGMVLVNSFNGAGDTMTPLRINIVAYWLVEIPLAWVLAIPFGMNENGVFTSILIAETLMTTISFFVFRRGKWKLKTV